MGSIISRWRKKPSTVETLEKLEKDIVTMEKQKRTNMESERRIVGSLLLYSVLLYIGATLLVYFYYLPDAWPARMKYTLPLLLFPILIWGLKRFLHWYFVKRITKNEMKLEDLRDKMKTILDEVMEKETYKKAKEILERFDASMGKKFEENDVASPVAQKAPEGQELRQRTKGTPSKTPGPAAPPAPGQAPVRPPPVAMTPSQVQGAVVAGTSGRPVAGQNTGQQAPQWGTPMRPPGPPMARPILPQSRSTSERLLEYLIGDGPQNRYALICKQCHSHNGMAYKEEFDYLNFRCCYCYTFNKARRQRPNAPRLDTPVGARRQLNVNTEPESGTDAETEPEEVPSSTTANIAPSQQGGNNEKKSK